MSDLQITLYGGASEIGGNRILLEWDDGGWLLDFGTRFAATGKYFEEFVKPRTAVLGLRDYFRMDLLPPLQGMLPTELWYLRWGCSTYDGQKQNRGQDALRS